NDVLRLLIHIAEELGRIALQVEFLRGIHIRREEMPRNAYTVMLRHSILEVGEPDQVRRPDGKHNDQADRTPYDEFGSRINSKEIEYAIRIWELPHLLRGGRRGDEAGTALMPATSNSAPKPIRTSMPRYLVLSRRLKSGRSLFNCRSIYCPRGNGSLAIKDLSLSSQVPPYQQVPHSVQRQVVSNLPPQTGTRTFEAVCLASSHQDTALAPTSTQYSASSLP